MKIQITINGNRRTFEADRSEPLLEILRRNGYTGAKRGCNEGTCGFCTVIIDGEAEKSCLRPAATVDGAKVETIENLGTQDDLHPIQEAFVDNAALQCGYCIPGMIMRTKALLESEPDPEEAEIRSALSDNLCRCTGYEKIIDAVEDASHRMEAEAVADGGERPAVAADSDGGDSE